MGEINNINVTRVLLARDYASTKMIKIPIIGIMYPSPKIGQC
jgi:hypothetical protein